MNDHKKLIKEYKARGNHKTLDRQRQIEIIQELRKVMTYAEIGTYLGLSANGVEDVIKRHGENRG